MSGSLIGPGYLAAVLLVVFPIAEFVTGVWPLRPESLQWRYGAVGLSTGYLLTPLLGFVLAAGVAAAAGHDRALRWMANLSILLSLLIAALMVSFTLDVMQLRGGVVSAARPRFDTGAISAGAKYVLVMVVLAWFGIGFRRTGRGKGGGRDSAPIVRKS